MKKIILISFFLFAKGLEGCSCATDSAFTKEDFDGYSYIIKGEIVSVETDGWVNTYKVKIISYFKSIAELKDEYLYVTTHSNSGMCGYNFMIGWTYIIYGHDWRIESDKTNSVYINTNRCYRNTYLFERETAILKRFTSEKYVGH